LAKTIAVKGLGRFTLDYARLRMTIFVCLWYPTKSVKPEKPDFEHHSKSILNNLYLLVII